MSAVAALACAALALLSPDGAVRAQSAAADRAAVPAPRDGVLLLKNGHVLSGRITWAGDHYFVDRGGLQVGVRTAEVLLAAADMDDAYRRQRDMLARDDLDGHQALVRWCLRHDLLALASEELALCTALDPRNRRTATLAQQLQSAARVAQSDARREAVEEDRDAGERIDRARRATGDAGPGAPAAAATPNAAKPTADAAATSEDVLGQISDEAAETFVRRIQPLLVNQCASGGCHGGASSAELQLVRFDPRKTPSRAYTERNLAAVLRMVDRDRPEASRLVTAPSEPHGPLATPVFAGRSLAHQAELAAWVRLVAGDMSGGARGAGRRADAGRSHDQAKASTESRDAGRGSIGSGRGDNGSNPHDPAIFNRRYFPDGRAPAQMASDPSPPDHVQSDRAAPDSLPPNDGRRSHVEDDIPAVKRVEEGEVARKQAR